MIAPNDDSLDRIECDLLVEDSGARVVIRRAVRKAFDALDERTQGRFRQVMTRWCGSPAHLTPEMFNGNEGRTSRHNAMLQAFKNNAAKVRLYGFVHALSSRKTFIIVDIDIAKKQNKANPTLLKRAKSRTDTLLDTI